MKDRQPSPGISRIERLSDEGLQRLERQLASGSPFGSAPLQGTAVSPGAAGLGSNRRGFHLPSDTPHQKRPPCGGLSRYGAPERIRTSDTRLRKPVLYPAELRALIALQQGGLRG